MASQAPVKCAPRDPVSGRGTRAWRPGSGERHTKRHTLALRTAAKGYALPLGRERAAVVTAQLRDLLHSDPDPDAPPPDPRAADLTWIGDRLREMELFDEAVDAYRRAAAAGATAMDAVAATLEASKRPFRACSPWATCVQVHPNG